jgi:hypothetical protein
MNAGAEPGINLQDVFPNPFLHRVMQVSELVQVKALQFALRFIISDKFPELFMRHLVLGMGRTLVTFHALFLALEMDVRIGPPDNPPD